MENTHYFESNLVGRRARSADGSGPIGEIILITLDPGPLLEGVLEPVAFLMDPDGKVVGGVLRKLQIEPAFGHFDQED